MSRISLEGQASESHEIKRKARSAPASSTPRLSLGAKDTGAFLPHDFVVEPQTRAGLVSSSRSESHRCLTPPPCKSAFQRAMLIAALGRTPCRIEYEPVPGGLPEDVHVLHKALLALGLAPRTSDANLRAFDVGSSRGWQAPSGLALHLGMKRHGLAQSDRHCRRARGTNPSRR